MFLSERMWPVDPVPITGRGKHWDKILNNGTTFHPTSTH